MSSSPPPHEPGGASRSDPPPPSSALVRAAPFAGETDLVPLASLPAVGAAGSAAGSATSAVPGAVAAAHAHAHSHAHAQAPRSAIDCAGPASTLKALFSLPLLPRDGPGVGIAIRNVGGGTLLLDHAAGFGEAGWGGKEEEEGGRGGRRRTSRRRRRPVATRPAGEEDEEAEEDRERAREPLPLTLDGTAAGPPALEAAVRAVLAAAADGASVAASASPALPISPPPTALLSPSSPARPPRRQLEWRFRDLNMLVGSDALLCRPGPDPDGTGTGSGTGDGGTLAVRVADLAEVRQQVLALGRGRGGGGGTDADADADAVAVAADRSDAGADPGGPSWGLRPASYADAVLREAGYVPAGGEGVGAGGGAGALPPSSNLSPPGPSAAAASPALEAARSAAACTVLDAYLDNLMANVPQLALCLRERGLVRSVRLLRTEDIPSDMMDPSILPEGSGLGGCGAAAAAAASGRGAPAFDPQMVETSAAALFGFLKAHCSRENATYLLRRDAGESQVRLYDVSSMSERDRGRWVWWLATMSYRFALRLGELSQGLAGPGPAGEGEEGRGRRRALRRDFRYRQRGLLQNALELLEELDDRGGGTHETVRAAVHDHLAGTFLVDPDGVRGDDDDAAAAAAAAAAVPATATATATATAAVDGPATGRTGRPAPVATSFLQPFGGVPLHSLEKAQDHLVSAVHMLRPLLEEARRIEGAQRLQDGGSSSSGSEDELGGCPVPGGSNPEIEAISLQLHGIVQKLTNVALSLAEHHLQKYQSSSAMTQLRSSAKNVAYMVHLLASIDHLNLNGDASDPYLRSIRSQYAWIWEYCGRFARSFADDELWRERGHASGEDVVSLLQDVEAACSHLDLDEPGEANLDSSLWIGDEGAKTIKSVLVTLRTQGIVSLQSLTPIVAAPSELGSRGGGASAVAIANSIMREHKVMKRERRLVLVAASICYGRAAAVLLLLPWASNELPLSLQEEENSQEDDATRRKEAARDSLFLSLLRQRLGDTCNEIGQILLAEVKIILETPFAKQSVASDDRLRATGPLLLSAKFWFNESLKHLEETNDLRNIALLHCNLCQCCKIRANAKIALPNLAETGGKDGLYGSHAEICLKQGADHLQAAHVKICERDAAPMTWDMVSTELAATLLVLGVRRRQSLLGSGATPVVQQALRLHPGKERAIVEPIKKAMKIYGDLGNHHQAAAANYQLGLYFSKIWTCQRDEVKAREKLSAAFRHFGAAHIYFSTHMRGNEPTFVILSLDFAGLFSATNTRQGESSEKALQVCLGTCDAFSPEAILEASRRLALRSSLPDDREWFDKMSALGKEVEESTTKLLQKLAKMEKEGESDIYRSLYRAALTAKIAAFSPKKDVFASDPASCSIAAYGVLKAIRDLKD